MPWQCRLVDRQEQIANGQRPQPGDMWFVPTVLEGQYFLNEVLSNEYKRDWLGKRPPIVVYLPDKNHFCVDSMEVGGHGDGRGWTVSGDAPNITVMPSINCVGTYHGWIQNGVISDDCEGRKFEGSN